jgi:hypothetical protein
LKRALRTITILRDARLWRAPQNEGFSAEVDSNPHGEEALKAPSPGRCFASPREP